jgi:hypothetical protein
MIEALIALGYVLGAFLRRMFGGWIGLRRSLCTILIVSATVAPFWTMWHGGLDWDSLRVALGGVSIPFPVPTGEAELLPLLALMGVSFTVPVIVKALLATAFLWVHWVDGHRFDCPWWCPEKPRNALVVRYSIWGPIPIFLLTGFWPVLLLGPIVAVGIILCNLLPQGWRLHFPWDTEAFSMIDGSEGLWEMAFLGGPSVALLWAAVLYS